MSIPIKWKFYIMTFLMNHVVDRLPMRMRKKVAFWGVRVIADTLRWKMDQGHKL